MDRRLENKVAVVSGAGSMGTGWGNGKAAAVLFAREGGKVLAVDRTALTSHRPARGGASPRGIHWLIPTPQLWCSTWPPVWEYLDYHGRRRKSFLTRWDHW